MTQFSGHIAKSLEVSWKIGGIFVFCFSCCCQATLLLSEGIRLVLIAAVVNSVHVRIITHHNCGYLKSRQFAPFLFSLMKCNRGVIKFTS